MAKRVLLIDYEPRSVERLKGLLTSPEYEILVARDGEEGLSVFSSSPRFDAILVAGMLPRLLSGEVVREIRRKGGATAPPILLMVSGYKGSNPKADAQRVGAFDILVKPFSDESLRHSVETAIDSTDVGAKTVRIPKIDAAAQAELTASDIFSDVLKEVAAEGPPAAPAPSGKAAGGESDIERRLRDTLSDVMGERTPRPAAPSAPARPAAPAAPSHSKFSADADIDRMISDTLSGLTPPPRTRPPAPPGPKPDTGVTPPPRVAPPKAPAAGAKPPFPAAPAARPPSTVTPPPEPPKSPVAPPPRPEPARPAETPVSASGPDRFGQYELLERIATGGMAELYKARRSGVEGFEKIVAIKKILPHLGDNEGFIAMFADEAKLAAQLNHPNIVHIYDLGKIEGGGYFIAMEHVEGRDLRAILESARELGTPLPVPLAVYVASKVASALDYAHRRRDPEGRDLHIVHRDVSPQNILISYEGDIKLCDFGIAKATSKVSQTESGALKGKIPYMSPEQAWGKPIDRRSDLFSLGVVLHEMLTEQKLFRGDSDLTVLEKVRAAVVTAPSSVNPEVPQSLDVIVLKALARDAEERYTNASDMLRDLESVLYSYTPAPGSADLAIYLHRLQAEETAAAEAKAREATRAVPEAEPKPRKSKGIPVARRTASAPKAVAPAPGPPAPGPKPVTTPGVFGAYVREQAEAEKKSRTALYATIGIAAVALAAGLFWWSTRKPAPAPVAPVATPLPTTPLAAAPVPTEAPQTAALDSKKVEEEVQRQLAAKRKELQKSMEADKKLTARAAVATAAAEPTAAPASPTAVPVVAQVEPTPVPTEPPPPPPTAAPAPTQPELRRGDLVGPGPGVVEPALVSLPAILYPPMARQERVFGKVVVLALVDENGKVAQTRLQQGVETRSGVNEAVVAAVRRGKFRPATKEGIPVKMWRTIVVDVKP